MLIVKVTHHKDEINAEDILTEFKNDIEETIEYDKELGLEDNILDDVIGHILATYEITEGLDDFINLVRDRWKI